MPGHFTHIYTARRVADYLLNNDLPKWWPQTEIDYEPQKCGEIMKKWEKFTAIGAIGPDLFYFSQDYNNPTLGPVSDEIMLSLATYYFFYNAYNEDWEPILVILDKVNSTMAALIRFLIKLDKIWKEFVKGWNATIGPIVEDIDNLGDSLSGGIVREFKGVMEQLKIALTNIIKEELVTFTNIFDNFNTCVQKGYDEKLFLWSDMSHYRRTSLLCQALVKESKNLKDAGKNTESEQFLAFALGYMTHLGTDTVAHSFVNEQCGGPFRNHPQRHHLIENHIDAWNYNQTKEGGLLTPDDHLGYTKTYPDISMSAMWFAVQMEDGRPEGQQRPDPLPKDPEERKRALSVDGEMPKWMADSIVKALISTFNGTEHPEIFQGSKFQSTIDENLLTKIIRDVTGKGLDRPIQELLDGIAQKPQFDVPVGFPLPWQIRTVYKIMLSFYRLQFNGTWELEKPRKPDFVIFPPASDYEDLLQPPDLSGIDLSNPIDDICGILVALVEWVTKVIDAGIKLAEDLIRMLTSPFTYLIRLALHELAIMIWDTSNKVHEVLSHTGFFMPHAEHYYDNGELRLANEIDEPLITLGQSVSSSFREALASAIDPFGNLDRSSPIVDHSVQDPQYPYYPVLKYNKDGSVEDWEYHRPWAWPNKSKFQTGDGSYTLVDTPTETYNPRKSDGDGPDIAYKPMVPGPYPLYTKPNVFFRLDAPINEELRKEYEQSNTPWQTDYLNLKYMTYIKYSPLGDPIPFSVYLIGQIANPTGYITQYNLDSDRAFAYLTWDWIREESDVPENRSTGALNLSFIKPVVPPRGAPGWAKGTEPLQIRYKDDHVDLSRQDIR